MTRADVFEDIGSITQAIKSAGQWISDTAAWAYSPIQWLIDWSPLLGHFALFAVVVVLCGFIARFLPDKVKLWVLTALGFAAAFIAGEVNQHRKRLAADRAKRGVDKVKEDADNAKADLPARKKDEEWRWPKWGS